MQQIKILEELVQIDSKLSFIFLPYAKNPILLYLFDKTHPI